MTVTIKPRLSGIPTFVFVIDSKTGTEKSANTNKKKRKTKPITEKNCVHLAISIKWDLEAFVIVICSNCVIGCFIIMILVLFDYIKNKQIINTIISQKVFMKLWHQNKERLSLKFRNGFLYN